MPLFSKVIHLARTGGGKGGVHYLILRQLETSVFRWFKMNALFTEETETDCSGRTVPTAIANARKRWKEDAFRTVLCGFRYSLPVRDEVGCNALFWEMAASYSAGNSQYYDEASGQWFFVDNASEEALEIWRKIRAIQKEK